MVAWRLLTRGATAINRQLLLVSGTGFLLMLGLGVLFPVLPYYRDDFGLSELEIGTLMSSYALASVMMAPLWGRFSDRYGRKPALLIGLLGFSLGFGLFALGQTFWQWLGARVLGGVLAAAALPTILSYTADVTPPERRNVALGTVGAAIGLGVLFGPALGGAMTRYGLAAPFFLTSAIGLFAALAVALVLPESLTPEIRAQARLRRQQLAGAGLGTRQLARALAPFLGYSLLVQTGRTGLESTIGFLVDDRLAGGPASVGLLLAGLGMAAVLVQGGGIRLLARRYDDHSVMRAGTAIQMLGLLGLVLAHDWPTVIAAALAVGIGSALLTPTFTAELSRAAERRQGEAQGLNASAQSLGRAIGPLIFTPVYQYVSGGATYALAGAVCALALVIGWRRLGARPDSC